MANFNKYTRYTNGETSINREAKQFLVLRSPLNLTPAAGDLFITITQDLLVRPDLISFKAYGIPDLWWAIYEYNGIRDPLFDLQIGQTLAIPNISRVLAAINQLGKT